MFDYLSSVQPKIPYVEILTGFLYVLVWQVFVELAEANVLLCVIPGICSFNNKPGDDQTSDHHQYLNQIWALSYAIKWSMPMGSEFLL